MGMYDSIYFKCENCGEIYEAQSKSGNCNLGGYDHTSVPEDVAEDANRHAPFRCLCGARYEFDIPKNKRVYLEVKKLSPPKVEHTKE